MQRVCEPKRSADELVSHMTAPSPPQISLCLAQWLAVRICGSEQSTFRSEPVSWKKIFWI